MGSGRGLQIGPCVILTMQDDNPLRLNATRFANFCPCSSPCGCAPRCPCPWQVKMERLIVHKRALCAVRTSLLSTYDPVASFRGAGIDRYRSGMPRVGAARSLFIFIPWAPPLRSVGRGAGRGLQRSTGMPIAGPLPKVAAKTIACRRKVGAREKPKPTSVHT